MEAIPKEVIDMAEDFFIHLDAKEKKDILHKYYLEQPYIAEIHKGWLETITYKGTIEKSEYMFFVIYRCYQYYGIKLPIITAITVRETFDRFMSNFKTDDEKPITNLETFIRLKTTLQQEYLLDYVILQIVKNDECPPQYTNEKDIHIISSQIRLLLWIFNNEIKNQLNKQIN